MQETVRALFDFASLLLFPFLGLLTLLRRRAMRYLAGAVIAWLAVGALMAWNGQYLGMSERRFTRSWLLGLALGASFLLVAWLKDRRPVARWLKLTMAAITLAVFVRALFHFFSRYA